MENQVNGETFNVGGGTDISLSLLELTGLCQELSGNRIQIDSESQNREADIRIYISDCKKVAPLT